MDILETLSSKISFTGKEAKRKAKEITDIAKLNSSIYKENAKLKELYYGLGQLYYNKHKDEPEDEFGLMIRNITASLETIHELKDKVQQVKDESEAQKKANVEESEKAGFCSEEDVAPVDAPVMNDDTVADSASDDTDNADASKENVSDVNETSDENTSDTTEA